MAKKNMTRCKSQAKSQEANSGKPEVDTFEQNMNTRGYVKVALPEPDFEGLDKIREGKTYQAAYNLLLEMIRVIVRAEEENKQEKLQILDQMYGLLAYLINRIEKESKGSGTKVTKVLSSPKIKSYNSHH